MTDPLNPNSPDFRPDMSERKATLYLEPIIELSANVVGQSVRDITGTVKVYDGFSEELAVIAVTDENQKAIGAVLGIDFEQLLYERAYG